MTNYMTWVCTRCKVESEHSMVWLRLLPGLTPPEGKSWEHIDNAHLCDHCYIKFRELLAS